LSSQCIVFMEKCISVPRVRKQIWQPNNCKIFKDNRFQCAFGFNNSRFRDGVRVCDNTVNSNDVVYKTRQQQQKIIALVIWIWVVNVLFLWKNVFLFHVLGNKFFTNLLIRNKYFDWGRF
jgi:hypothetical protein